jgi:lysophospholipase L1-like esterase
LEAHRSAAYQNHFTLFGISFTNSKPGIVYHSIGGNGAKFKHYLSSSYFFEQTKELSPDLIIISLGTNEAVDFPQIDKNLSDQIDQFLKQINTCNPDVPVLITTPFDFYKSKTKRNPGVEEIRTLLLKKPVAIWDGYEIGGGKHSADKWKKNKLLQTDGIHATKEGYELQALLLYQALMKSYKNYVQHRHP